MNDSSLPCMLCGGTGRLPKSPFITVIGSQHDDPCTACNPSTMADGAFASCICHHGIMWEPDLLDSLGRCPQFHHEVKEIADDMKDWFGTIHDPDSPLF